MSIYMNSHFSVLMATFKGMKNPLNQKNTDKKMKIHNLVIYILFQELFGIIIETLARFTTQITFLDKLIQDFRFLKRSI